MTIINIARKVKSIGGETYFVGGYVRDTMRKKPSNDVDIVVTGISEIELESILGNVKLVGKSFGVYKLESMDIALARRETSVGDAHTDFVYDNIGVTIEEDLGRRDFTINAIARNILTGVVIDPYKGEIDIERGIIRQISEDAIKEDYLRALRAIQFSARFGYIIESKTFANIIKYAEQIKTVAPERIQAELTKLIRAEFIYDGFEYLRQSTLLEYILPEINLLNSDKYNFIHHKYNTYYHTLHMLQGYDGDLVTKWAMLLHDVGKYNTTTIDEYGVYHNYRHETEGIYITKKILKRLKFDNNFIDDVSMLVGEHMIRKDSINHKTIRKVMSRIGIENMYRLKTLMIADKNTTRIPYNLNDIARLETIIDDIISEENALKISDLMVNGYDIMKLGFKGKEIGDVLKYLFNLVLDNPELNEYNKLIERIPKII